MRKTLIRPAMAVVRNPSVSLVPRRGAHERSFLGLPELVVGPPVDWNLCLKCLKEMSQDEERYRIEIKGSDGAEVGVRHRECQEELLGHLASPDHHLDDPPRF